ncbi:hypothetical protein COV04_03340 [Candidatus Uhrbacteria bacterium CG10_big_fil_rev_8_21_14_0_10_48_11]|uniref:Uncharacterized protein n=1 Tax=Candidatus Uhrbacteria bacterium CG10_big_fil_rev_8_21_14_0_10_48_11 TaxID=1975037 RepID=A0A2M8LE33_9BACT|nr:MAG: hypothetical protein COV04_03340 [Candidatus Uhrbacteria bacterium CG10_big_fil_rev_8_21_14_0_10_48_11]
MEKLRPRQNETSQQESTERTKRYRTPLESFRRWGKIGELIGASLLLTGPTIAEAKSLVLDPVRYSTEQANLPEEEREAIRQLQAKLQERFGAKTIEQIFIWDNIAFGERRTESPPTNEVPIYGDAFKKMPVDVQQLFTELPEVFPKSWLQDEIDGIYFIDKPGKQTVWDGEIAQVSAEFTTNFVDRNEALQKFLVYQLSPGISHATPEACNSTFRQTIAHELAHANDWLTDRALTLLERYEMLDQIAVRLASADHYQNPADGKRNTIT